MKSLKIGTGGFDRTKAHTMAIARVESNPGRVEPTIWLAFIARFSNLHSERNRRLLTLIAQEKPESLSEMAEHAGWNRSNLSQALKTMPCYGPFDLIKGERRAIVPRLPYGQACLEVRLASAVGISERVIRDAFDRKEWHPSSI